MPEDRRHIAVMFTDIVGYTALMGHDEDKAFDMLKRNHTIHASLIKKHNGKLVKEVGDGTLASFPLASDAVRCASDIQNEAKNQNIPLKIGIHQGEMVLVGADVLGDAVNVASRLQESAEEGCISISGAVYRDVKNKAGIETEFIRDEVLKNVDDPIKVYKVHCKEEESTPTIKQPARKNNQLYYVIAGLVVVIAAILIWQYLPTRETGTPSTLDTSDKTIAVIPFWNDSPNPDNAYFCSGMEEAIRINLLKIAELQIESRQSVEKYRQNPEKDMTSIGAELGVAFVVEGSVQKIGDDVRVNVQLIDAKTGNHIWGETYDGDYTQKLLTFQSKTAKQIATSLNAVITPDEEISIESLPTKDISAYNFYIRGHYESLQYWKTLDDKHLRSANDLLDEALKIDTDYLEAINGKGLVFVAKQNYDSAIIYAERAITIDPELPDGYGLKGECFFCQGKYDLAIENYLKAISLLSDDKGLWWNVALGRAYGFQKNGAKKAFPLLTRGFEMRKAHLPSAYYTIGTCIANTGDYEKAKEYIQKSLELNTGCMQIGFYSWILTIQSKHKEALHFLDSVCEKSSCEGICYKYKFHIHLVRKEFDLAEQYINQLSEGGYTFNLGDRYWYQQHIGDSVMLAYMYKELGREDEALTILNNSHKYLDSQLEEDKNWLTYLILSFIHAILDEKEEALKYLSEVAELGFNEGFHDFIKIHPIFENLRDDPEFKAIVKRAQDEKAVIRARVQEMIDSGEIDL